MIEIELHKQPRRVIPPQLTASDQQQQKDNKPNHLREETGVIHTGCHVPNHQSINVQDQRAHGCGGDNSKQDIEARVVDGNGVNKVKVTSAIQIMSDYFFKNLRHVLP